MSIPTTPPTYDDPYARWCSFAGPGDPRRSEPEPIEPASPALAKLAAAEQAAEQAVTGLSGLVSSCPGVRLHALQATVVDDDDVPLADQLVRLRRGASETMSAKTDAQGHVRFEGLEPGDYELGLAEIDGDGWHVLGNEALTDGREFGRSMARWVAPAHARAATIEHVVEPGQCLSTLAYRHGWSADALWAQNPDLAKIRESKNVLAPGDVVLIPPVRVVFDAVSSARAYRLCRTAALEQLRIQFLGDDDAPRKAEPYLLTLVGELGEIQRSGKTDGDGMVIERLPSSTHEVRLVLGERDRQEHHLFRVAHLDPIDTIAGLQARLFNLDFEVDRERGTLGPITRRALAEFQAERGLTVSGEPDDATRDALREQHRT